MKVVVCFSLFLLGVSAVPFDPREETVEPEYLDQLLEEKRYEEFSEILGLGDPELAYSKAEQPRSRHEAMMNKKLIEGDMILASQPLEESRQAINFTKYGGSKWPANYVPYAISNQFSASERKTIEDAIRTWNSQVRCVELRQRGNEGAYVNVFPGDGCWAHVGRTGRVQSVSLEKPGCVYPSVILHEFQHAIGFTHEQNREDRDNFIEMLWHNIPEDWQSQYNKVTSPDWVLRQRYDYYSIMHYPVNAPGTRKPAFRVRQSGIDEKRIGNGDSFTKQDINKICEHYR